MATQNKKPNFLVAGATGHQGGAVIKSLLKSGKYMIRGIAKNLNNERARMFRDQGVEMIACDYTKCDELKNALKGVEIFFAMTDFYDPSTMGKECQIGTSLVDCAKEMGVKHFIWSSLPNVEKLTGGKLKVPHFTEKAKVGEYAMKTLPTTLICPASYYQNFTEGLWPCKKENNNTMIFTMPRISNLAAVDINDLGDAVLKIAENRNEWLGKCIPLAGERMPLQRFFDQMEEVCGCKVKWNEISSEDFAKLNISGAKELAEMCEWIDKNGYFGPNADLSMEKKLGCKMRTFKEFLEQTKVNPK
jgi:uncharacterized protein YbjT (DUF2867 family)